MKKKIIKITFCVLLIGIGIFIGSFSNKGKSFEDDTSEPKHIKEKNTLSMMIEQTAGAGDYKMETRTSWPTDGYMFNATLSKCENGGELGWDDTNKVVTMTGNMSDKCYIYFDVISIISDVCSSTDNLASCIVKLGDRGHSSNTNIYHHDGTLENGIDDGSYRYAGASSEVNNYVCFGSTEATCPTDNLYRIIGVFGDQVKLIKSTAASSTLLGRDGDYASSTSYYWNYKNNTSVNSGNGSNTWSTSLLNNTNLNTNYINNIGSTWASKIAETTWKVGGNTWANVGSVVAKTAYQNDVTSPVTTNTTDNATTYPAKIGLMYVSDYGFAANPAAWETKMGSYKSYKSVNWMVLGSDEWPISRYADYAYTVFTINSGGSVGGTGASNGLAVRPVFYLVSTATYSSGTGTSTDPIILGD